jgi:hypothetical protein
VTVEPADKKSIREIMEPKSIREIMEQNNGGSTHGSSFSEIDDGASEASLKEIEESMEKVEAAIAVFRRHAEKLGIDEKDLLRAVHESYTRT